MIIDVHYFSSMLVSPVFVLQYLVPIHMELTLFH